MADPFPHGNTARRLEWQFLPPRIRDLIAARCGSSVQSAESRNAGFTPGFASVLTCADGTRHFVKAASVKAQRQTAEAYAEEVRKLELLPAETPAPRLDWSHRDEDWVVLGFEYVEARAPHRPWVGEEVAAASQMLVAAAEVLTPAEGLGLSTFAEDFAQAAPLWPRIGAGHPELPPWQVAEAAALTARHVEVTAGDTVVHTDVRDDNLLVRPDGSVLLCDWNWPCRGAAWLDSLLLLIGPRGDGFDVEAHLREHPLLGEVPAEDIDTVLALLAAYFFTAADQPGPPNSPHLRRIQAWQRDVVWGWLGERRGWSS
ncbi:phosphotransferase family protein [Nocardioides limicola]|uniref:phosphotransferase family protein n=1 Tax=Nocardioides limicola TaxID=2803368 RepID=UPI00193B6602|nr:phosphotransferase [Nocardioides sp. DJM-14]